MLKFCYTYIWERTQCLLGTLLLARDTSQSPKNPKNEHAYILLRRIPADIPNETRRNGTNRYYAKKDYRYYYVGPRLTAVAAAAATEFVPPSVQQMIKHQASSSRSRYIPRDTDDKRNEIHRRVTVIKVPSPFKTKKNTLPPCV
ncbi:unnamed protein product [Ectocarpus sp. 8 AP-2014]